MIKFIALPLAAVLIATTVTAQTFKVEKSEVFDEPSVGWNKVFQLSNGNTFFFHGARKEGLTVTVYDKKRVRKAVNTIESSLWDADGISSAFISGLYEINGQPVLFLKQAEKEYRVVFKAEDGSVASEEALAEPEHGKIFRKYIDVIKDPASDCYAVTYVINKTMLDHEEQVTVYHYDGTHKLINQASYPGAGAGMETMRYRETVVDGNKRVFLRMIGCGESPESETSVCKTVLSRLNAGEKTFTHKLLKITQPFASLSSLSVFDHKQNKIRMVSVVKVDSKLQLLADRETKYYTTSLVNVDPESMEVSGEMLFNGTKVTEYARKHIDKDYTYSGVTSGMLLNDDNTITMTMEEHSFDRNRDVLGDIGICNLNGTGGEFAGYVICKNQGTVGSTVLRQNYRTYNMYSFASPMTMPNNTPRYMSYDYIAAAKGQFVIFNDVPKNFDRDEHDSKRANVWELRELNTIICRLNGDSIDKMYLFGEPDKTNTACYIDGSDFNRKTNTYATVITERKGRDAQSQIAWVTFE